MATLEINYQNMAKNAQQLLQSGKGVIAIVKNNAYNMELEESVKTFYREGITYFATTNLKEAVKIREILGTTVDIFLLNPTTEFEIVKQYNIEVNIASFDYLERNIENLQDLKLHLEFAGSMRRAGAKSLDEAQRIVSLCLEKNMKLKAFWSHFSHADEFDGLYEKEREVVLEVYKELAKVYTFEVVHLQNSASYFRDGAFAEVTHIRPGIMLYGAYPYNVSNNPFVAEYKPAHVFSVIANVVNVVTLQAGESIGYCNAYVAKSEKKVATVDIGYGDGILRSRLTGKICLVKAEEKEIYATMMSHIVIDGENVTIGDEVIIYNEKLPVYNYTKYCGANSEQMAVLNKNTLEIRKINN